MVARPLILGPAGVRAPAARWAVNLLALAGAALLVWSGEIHLRLWSEGFSFIPTIGPLFLAQGIGAIVVALALAALRRLVLLLAGIVAHLAAATALLISVNVGLFGYRESLQIPDAQTSLAVEFGGAGALVIAVAILLMAGRSRLPVPGRLMCNRRSNPDLIF